MPFPVPLPPPPFILLYPTHHPDQTDWSNSLTVGSYTNQMNYIIKDNMRLSTSLSLSSPMNGINPYANNGLAGAQVYYGASLDYQPTKNLFIKFSMDNYPRYGFARSYPFIYRSR